jgi:hypothetical protein
VLLLLLLPIQVVVGVLSSSFSLLFSCGSLTLIGVGVCALCLVAPLFSASANAQESEPLDAAWLLSFLLTCQRAGIVSASFFKELPSHLRAASDAAVDADDAVGGASALCVLRQRFELTAGAK